MLSMRDAPDAAAQAMHPSLCGGRCCALSLRVQSATRIATGLQSFLTPKPPHTAMAGVKTLV